MLYSDRVIRAQFNIITASQQSVRQPDSADARRQQKHSVPQDDMQFLFIFYWLSANFLLHFSVVSRWLNRQKWRLSLLMPKKHLKAKDRSSREQCLISISATTLLRTTQLMTRAIIIVSCYCSLGLGLLCIRGVYDYLRLDAVSAPTTAVQRSRRQMIWPSLISCRFECT